MAEKKNKKKVECLDCGNYLTAKEIKALEDDPYAISKLCLLCKRGGR